MVTHPEPHSDLLSSTQAAATAGISLSTLFRAEKAGRITPLRTPGGHRRYRCSDVEALLTQAPASPGGHGEGVAS